MNASRLAFAALAMLAPSWVSAADLPVSYTVQEKPLKAAIAGTSLTFELYSDGTCATLAQSLPVNVENVTLITKMKQMTPKNDTKLPNTVELRTTLAGVSATGTVYLKVTGTGVTPVGGACQVQVASVPAGAPTLSSGQAIIRSNTYTINPVWSFEGYPNLGFETYRFVLMTPESALALQPLDRTRRYDCTFAYLSGATSGDANGNPTVNVYGISGCVVQPATCSDGLLNQGEGDIDCGGPCSQCSDLLLCNAASDCSSGYCATVTAPLCVGTGQRCIPAHCFNALLDGGESDIDCGHTCGLGCGLGQACGPYPCAGDCDCLTGNTCSSQCGVGVCQ